MPKGQMKDAVAINGWLMRSKKVIPTRDETLYHCIHRNRTAKCQAAYAVHNITNDVRIIKDHFSHEVDQLENSTRFARQDLKRRANEGPCRDVIDSVRADYGPYVSIAAGSYQAKRRVLYRAKTHVDRDTKAMNAGGPISDKYRVGLEGERFLISDHDHNNLRYVIFGTDESLKLLSSSNVVFVDGTFECVPDGFTQLFSFHCYLNDSVVRPVLYTLLPNKQLDTYEHILENLKNLPQLTNWNPEVVINFELNIKTAFEKAFPQATIHGCLFHLIQSWKRKAEKLKIFSDMCSGFLHEFWQLLKVLPFIDSSQIGHYFSVIQSTLPQMVPPALNTFIEYLDTNYVTGGAGGVPRYPPTMWSCSDLSLNAIHRTTNVVECWHGLLQTVVTKKRQVSCILKDQKLKAAIENTPLQPKDFKTDLQVLNSFVLAKKY